MIYAQGGEVMSDERKNYLDVIDNLVRQMKFGTVTIIVQDGKVIQIDKTDKIRLKN